MRLQWRFLFFLLVLCPNLSTPFAEPVTDLQHPCKRPYYSYPFCNTSLSIAERAESIVSLLTLPEKIQQLSNNASAVPRLGLPAYQWWSESLHGIASNGPGVSFTGSIPSATSFPQVLVSAASFNRTLWFLIGSAIAMEGRAMYNVGQAGLTFWAPNINIFRDPRWGRGQETPGEDPVLASAYAIEFVRGFQGSDWEMSGEIGDDFGEKRVLTGDVKNGDLMLSACCKHFTAYDLEKWMNFSRYSFNAVITEQDLEDTYQPPFRNCIEQGKASCLMCSYNEVNGIPACASKDLLQKVRTEWGFKGYITSDCDAVATIQEFQFYAQTAEDAVAYVLKAGMDINCGTFMLRETQSAVDQGKVKEEDIDRALLNLFSVQLRLGIFDGDPRKGKYGKLGPENVCSSQHRELALEAALQGSVLLKNNKKLLPLDKKAISSLAVVGPMARNASNLGGGYTGIPCNPMTLFDGLQAYVETTYYASGCHDVPCASDDRFEEAIQVAKSADFVVVVAGLDLSQETEDHDRESLVLPGKQMDLVSSVASASKRPIILVLTGGGPLDVSFAEGNQQIGSIIWIGYPGESGGKALAQIIFGDFNPGGRLPMTWYPESFTKVPMNDMNMRADPSRDYPGRTYRFYTGETVYRFGYGLSYTNFSYQFLSPPIKLSLSGSSLADPEHIHRVMEENNFLHVNEIASCNSLRFFLHIAISNNGSMDGSHIVLLFSKMPRVFNGAPEIQLIGFDRVDTVSSGTVETSVTVDPCDHFSAANEYGRKIIPFGDHILMLGELEHVISIGY